MILLFVFAIPGLRGEATAAGLEILALPGLVKAR
jgi:hypothetical protein